RVSAKSSRQSGKTVSLLDPSFYYQYQKGHPVLNIRLDPNAPTDGSKGRETRTLRREDLSPSQSVLSQKKDSDIYPEITYLGKQFGNIHIYREWNLGRYTEPRKPQRPDLPGDFLQPDASKLALVLNYLQNLLRTKRALIE